MNKKKLNKISKEAFQIIDMKITMTKNLKEILECQYMFYSDELLLSIVSNSIDLVYTNKEGL